MEWIYTATDFYADHPGPSFQLDQSRELFPDGAILIRDDRAPGRPSIHVAPPSELLDRLRLQETYYTGILEILEKAFIDCKRWCDAVIRGRIAPTEATLRDHPLSGSVSPDYDYAFTWPGQYVGPQPEGDIEVFPQAVEQVKNAILKCREQLALVQAEIDEQPSIIAARKMEAARKADEAQRTAHLQGLRNSIASISLDD